MPAAPEIRLIVKSVNDRRLQDNILLMSQATGRTVKEETRTVMRGLIRDAIIYTPPAGGGTGARGKDAQRQGEAAISRDLRAMGFSPRDLKGHRTITKAFGHPITPVTVKTKENPKFAEPDLFHLTRLQAKGGSRRASRGGKQAFYVSRQKFKAMVKRLYLEVGRLASGWVAAADQLGVAVPAWIRRHGTARGTKVIVTETDHKITMRVVNQFPDTAVSEATEMRLRIDRLKGYAIARLKRQLPHILRKNLNSAKRP